MLNYALLSKAINKLDERKQQAKPQVDAAKFINDISSKYGQVERYFVGSPTPLLDSGEEVFNANDITSLDYPITLAEIMEKL